MWVIVVALLITAIVGTSSFVISRWGRKRIRLRYCSKPRSEIVEARVFAKKFMVLSLCVAFLGPLPLSFIIARFAEGRTQTLIIGLMIVLIVSSITSSGYWWTVEGVTRSLLEELSLNSTDVSRNKQLESP